MQAILGLIAILVLGFISAHFLFGRLQDRLYFVTGVEFLLLGILCGPRVTNLVTEEVVYQLSPVVSLAIGALGVLYGLQFKGREWTNTEVEFYRISFIEVIFTLLIVGGSFATIFWFWFGPDLFVVFSSAAVLASASVVSAPTAVEAVARRFHAAGFVTDLLRFLIGFNQIVGITLFGLVFCIFRSGVPTGTEVTRTEWVAISLGIGLLLGLLFYLFLGAERSGQRLLLALMGIVIFSSGVAYYLHLSPLALNLFLGVVLGVASGTRARLMKMLLSFERPLYVLILIFAGAAWELASGPGIWVSLGLVALYILLRLLGKRIGGFVSQRSSPYHQRIPSRLGNGLVSQGAVAVAIAVNFQQVYSHALVGIVVSCILGAVLFNEFVGQRLTRNVLVDAGEIGSPAAPGESLSLEEGTS